MCGRLKFGTALATFDSKYSPYKNRDGPVIYDHAAVYLGCDSNGVTVRFYLFIYLFFFFFIIIIFFYIWSSLMSLSNENRATRI